MTKSPHEFETEENIEKALEVGKLKKKVKKIPKKIKKLAKSAYTDPIQTTAKKLKKEVTEGTPKRYKKGFKKLVKKSPEEIVKESFKDLKTAANAIESLIPGRKEAYLKRSKGGSVRKYSSGGAAKRGYGKARR
jgi:hypothetical protein